MNKNDIITNLQAVLKGISEEERQLLSQNSNNPENVIITITDSFDPKERGEYHYTEENDEFVEQTGQSNYIPIYTTCEFVEALKKFDYRVNVKLA